MSGRHRRIRALASLVLACALMAGPAGSRAGIVSSQCTTPMGTSWVSCPLAFLGPHLTVKATYKIASATASHIQVEGAILVSGQVWAPQLLECKAEGPTSATHGEVTCEGTITLTEALGSQLTLSGAGLTCVGRASVLTYGGSSGPQSGSVMCTSSSVP